MPTPLNEELYSKRESHLLKSHGNSQTLMAET